jgi:hypothetical protein
VAGEEQYRHHYDTPEMTRISICAGICRKKADLFVHFDHGCNGFLNQFSQYGEIDVHQLFEVETRLARFVPTQLFQQGLIAGKPRHDIDGERLFARRKSG